MDKEDESKFLIEEDRKRHKMMITKSKLLYNNNNNNNNANANANANANNHNYNDFRISVDELETDELILQLATRLSEDSNLFTFFDEYQHSNYMANDESDLLMIGMNLQYT
jgi:hypothetical protein